MNVGVDTGGTFTDVVARDANGSLRVHKLLSTPDDPSRAIADGVRALGGERAHVVHGTTVATNALLERAGGEVAFVTTAGFEDILRLGRQNRPALYELRVEVPEPLATRAFGAAERVAFDGRVVEPLTDAAIDAIVRQVDESGCDAVAICLLHSYANDSHEAVLAAALRERLEHLHVSVSSEIVREFREFERASTTVINAYVGPLMSRYIGAISDRLPDAEVEVLLSSGARATMKEAAEHPVHTALSGPAGGVVGALAAAKEVGDSQIITFDMGGTSTDVSLCEGEPTLTHSSTIGDWPLHVPVLDIYTVGAGGGSIAFQDPGGALRVGPRSAGASPGPACYGRGGEAATVTDAHAVLGRLRPDAFLGGEMTLDVDAARAAVGRVATSIGLSVEETARGILDVADATMVRAIKVISSQRGRDPRDFSLVAFGGAGGLHACRIADDLGMSRVIVPANPGVLSAYGMLHADRKRFYSQSVLAELDAAMVEATAAQLAAHATEELGASATLSFSVDLRYVGQSFEITLRAGTSVGEPPKFDIALLERRFSEEHERLYGYTDAGRPLELAAVRLEAVVTGAAHPARLEGALDGPTVERRLARVGFRDGDHDAALVRREEFVGRVDGPAVLTHYGSTTVVPAGWSAAEFGAHTVVTRRA